RAASERQYLYSFVGAYSPAGYLTPVRKWIVDLPPRTDAHVALRETWHYEHQVYGEQVALTPMSPDLHTIQNRRAREFDDVMLSSVFSLCPSGSGPNSIRLWESLGFGCIPVLLSDSLRLPGTARDWNEAILRVPETR